MKKGNFYPAYIVLGFIYLFANVVFASSDDDKINSILEMEKPPEGVVFEVASGKNALTWAIPKIEAYAKILRARHPKIKIAVVSHGREQFALTKKNSKKYSKVHKKVKSLVSGNIPVHICETHAGWRGVQASDYPKYISVSTQGPTEIQNYQEVGYQLVILKKPKQ